MAKHEPVVMHEEAEATPIRGNPDKSSIAHGYRQLPYDLPAYVSVTRLMGDFPLPNVPKEDTSTVRGLKGHVLEIEMFTFGVKILVRSTMDGVLRLYAQDGEGIELLGGWEK